MKDHLEFDDTLNKISNKISINSGNIIFDIEYILDDDNKTAYNNKIQDKI